MVRTCQESVILAQLLLLTAAMPPRFGRPLPSPSMDELIKEERVKIRKRAAEDEAKAASLGGAGSALRCKAGHPMMFRPSGPYSGMEYNGVDAGIMGPTSLMPGRAILPQSRALSSPPMLFLENWFIQCSFEQSCIMFPILRTCLIYFGFAYDWCSHCCGVTFCCCHLSWSCQAAEWGPSTNM